MNTVTSRDGTQIAFDQLGDGEPVIVVGGALSLRKHPMLAQLAQKLASEFKVYNYDRRGRGDSGDTQPYAVEREIEDIDVLIDTAGESVFLFGMSSGAVLALEAADKLANKVKKLAIYEPPFIVDDSRPPLPDDYVQQLNKAISENRRGDAIEIFMTKAIGVPTEFVAQMRNAPIPDGADNSVSPPQWLDMETVAHTLAYDGMIMEDTMSGKPLPSDMWNTLTVPALVIVGSNSEAFMHKGAKQLVDRLPDVQLQILDGQDHAVDSVALAPVLVKFFKS